MFRRSRSRVRRGTAGSLLVAVALGTAALGVTASGSGAAVPSQKADKAGVLRVGAAINDQGGVFFDPANQVNQPLAREWNDLIFGVMILQTPDNQGAPGLATEWSTPDPSTVQLTLRDGVKFSDGSPFTAAAVKAAWERTLASSNVPSLPPELKAITAIETPDDKTVVLRLSQPAAQKLVDEYLRQSTWFAVPSPASIAAGNVNQAPVGAGPYKLKSYTQGGNVVLERNPEYWAPKEQRLAGFEWSHIAAGPPQVSALQAGTIDVAWNPPPDSIQSIESQPGLEITSIPSLRVNTVNVCPTKGVFTNQQARQAAQWAVDKESLNDAALSGVGTPTNNLLTPAFPYYNKKFEKGYAYKPKKAKALLTEAGIAPGSTVNLLVSIQPPGPVTGEILQSNLEDVGLNVEVTQSSNLPSDARRVEPDMVVGFNDPSLTSLIWGQAGTLNPCGWNTPELLAALAVTKDGSKSQAEIQAAWDSFNEIMQEESVSIPLMVEPSVTAHTDKVQGLRVVNGIYGPQFDTVYLSK